MKFNLVNNHILLTLSVNNSKKGVFIIDTGSQISFSLNKDVKKIAINDAIYPIHYNPDINLKNIVFELVNKDVSGLIGMDILTQTNLTIDYQNNEIYFEAREGNVLCFLKDFNGSKVTNDIVINDNILNNTLFDTGACISYVSNKYLNEKDITPDKYDDNSPIFGRMDGYLYNARIDKVTLGSGSYGHNIKVGKASPQISALGIDSIINPSLLIDQESELAPNKVISFNFVNNSVCIS